MSLIGQTIFEGKTKTGATLILRYPSEKDLEILLNHINTLSEEKTFIRFQGEQLTIEDEKKVLDEWLKGIKEKKLVKLLLFVGDDLAGSSEITMRDRIASHVGNLGIAVTKKYRGQGLGEILMKKIIEEAKRNFPDLKIVYLGCFSNNTAALNLYKKLGFKEFGRLPKGIKYKGEYIDSINMYKEV